jgi:hypothetical protein
MRAISARIRHGWGVVSFYHDQTGGIMKRISIVIILMAAISGSAFAQEVRSHPLGNGRVLKFTNLLKDEYQPFFDYTSLAKEFDRISNDYGLSTDLDIGFNPSDKGIWLTVQGVKIDPKQSSKYRPIIEGEDTYLPLQLQAEAATAVYIWFMSFLANPVVPQNTQMYLAQTATKSTRFLVAIENELRTFSVTGSITGGRITFDPQFRWMDFSSGQFILRDIKLPQRPEILVALGKDLKLYLPPPDDNAKAGDDGETMGIYRWFGLKQPK